MQSGWKMIVPPTFVHVTPHPSGTTAGVFAVAISAAIIAVTIVGRIRRETNFNAAPRGDGLAIMDRRAIGSAILCFRLPGRSDSPGSK